jgi:uncharacterized protein DUF5681
MSESPVDDQVGYGKPHRQSRFRKGQSGNPRGRPKGSQNAARLARRILNEKIVIRENGRTVAITRREAMLKQLANKGILGDLRSIREVLNLDAAGAGAERRAKPITRIELVPVAPRHVWITHEPDDKLGGPE